MEIEHIPAKTQFVARLEDGRAVLDYELLDDGSWDMTHTYVPEKDRNQGIGSELVRWALDRASEEDRQVIPTCPFVSSFIGENPEYRALLRDAES